MPSWNRHPWQLAESPYGCPDQWTEGCMVGKAKSFYHHHCLYLRKQYPKVILDSLEGLQLGPPLWIWKMQRWWHLTHPYLSHPFGLWLSIQKTEIMASGPITSWHIDGQKSRSDRFYFLGVQNHCEWWLQPRSIMTLAPWKKSYNKPR